MTTRSALAALTVLMLVAMSACGSVDRVESAQRGGHPLVFYSREGGIRFQSSRLAVSTEGVATVRYEGCVVRFPVGATAWHRLRRALRRADLSALAGEYPAAPGVADAITELIVVGRDRVRIEDFSSLPAEARRELEPLLGVLRETLAQGEDRCSLQDRTVAGDRKETLESMGSE